MVAQLSPLTGAHVLWSQSGHSGSWTSRQQPMALRAQVSASKADEDPAWKVILRHSH